MDRGGGLVVDNGDVLADLKPAKWRQALGELKGAAEERRLPIALVVSPAASAAILSDAVWCNRFETIHIPRWRVDRDFLDLLAAWEAQLPLLEASALAEREMAMHLYALCDGRIGRLASVLRDAALAAVDAGTECITIPHCDNLGMTPPPTFRGFVF